MKIHKIILWALRGLLSLAFLLAGIGKFIGSEVWADMFNRWGYFDGFYLIIGILEVAAAIALLIPIASRWAIYVLVIILIGASITHLIYDPSTELIRPVIYLIMIAGIFLIQKKIA